MKYKVSMIIPIYNAQDTLKVAINSVINQTIGFENIELILVDDNSTDNSKDIINSYSSDYDNIKAIFLEENSGSPSKPRNVGIDNVTSPYLMFLDNDDEIIPDYCEVLYNLIEKENTDIIYCQNSSKFLDGVYAPTKHSKDEICEVEDPLSLRLTVWGGIFNTEFIKKNNIKCPPTLYEDGVFAIKAFTKANKIFTLPNYYGYVYAVEKKEDESITHKVSKETFYEFLKGFHIVNNYLNETKLNNEEFWIPRLMFPLYMFLKIDADKKEKINILKKYRELGLAINYPNIKLNPKPMDMLNKAIMNEQYNKAIFLSSIYNVVYNNRKLKNFIFKYLHNLKKIDIA